MPCVSLRGTGNVSPNPLVGCIIRDQYGCLLSSGAHLKHGESHAEVNALAQLTPQEMTQCRVTVSLEPCSHVGKTPPCTDALIRSKAGQVQFLALDLNPLVRGQGVSKLTDAKIPANIFTNLKVSLWIMLNFSFTISKHNPCLWG